jgi:3-hydroxyisobutyrate dehydrogenase-like beta-hydroxyacid dehydrogenase
MTIDTMGLAGDGDRAAAIAAGLSRAAGLLQAGGLRVIVHGFDTLTIGAGTAPKSRLERAPNLFDLASECEVVITAFATHAALRAALIGSDDRPGLLGAMAPGTLIVDFTPGSPEECRKLAGALAGRAVGLVEAATSGSDDAIKSGTAEILLGGFGEHIERLTPILQCLGTPARTGPQGSARMVIGLKESVRAAYQLAVNEAACVAAAAGISGELFGEPPLSETERAEFLRHVEQTIASADALGIETTMIAKAAEVLSGQTSERRPRVLN